MLIGRYIRNADEVEDVAQEAFIKAFRALPRFRGDSAFYTWLVTTEEQIEGDSISLFDAAHQLPVGIFGQ